MTRIRNVHDFWKARFIKDTIRQIHIHTWWLVWPLNRNDIKHIIFWIAPQMKKWGVPNPISGYGIFEWQEHVFVRLNILRCRAIKIWYHEIWMSRKTSPYLVKRKKINTDDCCRNSNCLLISEKIFHNTFCFTRDDTALSPKHLESKRRFVLFTMNLF